MSDARAVSYVIAVHNEERVLESTARSVVEHLQDRPGSELIIVENGSTDGSLELAQRLAGQLGGDIVSVRIRVTEKGFGNALREGIRVATGDVIVLTAADLPFGFSDLDRALARENDLGLVIGSKAHPDSVVNTTRQRKVMSWGFGTLRRLLFGIRVGDTQGSLIVDRRLAQELLPQLTSPGYFVSTELIMLAARAGHLPVEIPVDYSAPRLDSKVRPVRDSWDMLKALGALRVRFWRDQRAERSRRPTAGRPHRDASSRDTASDTNPGWLVTKISHHVDPSRHPILHGATLAIVTVAATVAGILAITMPLLIVGAVAERLRAHAESLAARPVAAVVAALLILAVPTFLGGLAGWYLARRRIFHESDRASKA